MENELKLNFEGHELTVIKKGEEPLWVAKEVAELLGYDFPRTMTRRLDDDEKGVQPMHTPGGTQKVSVINEFGLFKAILGSKKKSAKRFQRWVTHDVLPQIRRTGFYSVDQKVPQNYEEALEAHLKSVRENRKLKSKVTGLLPDAQYAREVQDSTSLMNITTIAKSLGTGPIKMNKFLVSQGVLREDNKLPKYKYQDRQDLFKIVTYTQEIAGETKTRHNLKYTEKGRRFVRDLWKKHHNELPIGR